MEKNLLFGISLIMSTNIYSQVGVNNTVPQATLDISAKTTDGSKPEGVIAPRLTGEQIKSADTQYTIAQKGTIVYATSAVLTPVVGSKTQNITSDGYYYFDGALWQKFKKEGTDINLYNSDGTLTGNRLVSQNNNALNFTGGKFVVGSNATANTNQFHIFSGATTSGMSLMHGKGLAITTDSSSRIYLENTASVSGQKVFQIKNENGLFSINPLTDDANATLPVVLAPAAIGIISNGNVGIGTNAPTNTLEIKSSTNNTSGLKLANLTSAAPVSAGATLGVDSSGNVVTVPGNAFSPASGRVVLAGTTGVTIPANTFNYNLLSFTLPTAGTYLITYSIRGEIQNPTPPAGAHAWLYTFLSTAPSAGNMIPNTEILIVSSKDDNRLVIGGTGTGNLITTITGPTTYYVGLYAKSLDGFVFNNADGRTSVSYAKITP